MISAGELAMLRRDSERTMTVLDVRPGFALDSSLDGCPGYSESSPEFGTGNAALGVSGTNLDDLRAGQLCEPMAFALGAAFRVQMVAIENTITGVLSAFQVPVGVVGGTISQPEVRWIHAGWIVAAGAVVQNPEAVWDISHDEAPGQAMGDPDLIPQLEFPVGPSWGGAGPKPAGIGEIDFAPEGTDSIWMHDELPFVVSGSGMLKHRRSLDFTIFAGIWS